MTGLSLRDYARPRMGLGSLMINVWLFRGDSCTFFENFEPICNEDSLEINGLNFMLRDPQSCYYMSTLCKNRGAACFGLS